MLFGIDIEVSEIYVIANRHYPRGSVFRHCKKNYVVIRRSNPVKNSDLQNFFNYLNGLSRRFAPRNDDLGIHTDTSPRNDEKQ